MGSKPMKAKDRFPTVAARWAAVLLGMFVCSASSLAQENSASRKLLVGDVIVQGNRHKATQEITSLLKTRVGVEYNADVVQEDVRTLLATNQFGNVQARYNVRSDGKVEVFFIVVDYPNVIE